MSCDTWDRSFYTSMIGRLLSNNELENLDKQLCLDEVFINCRDNQCFYAPRPLHRRYVRESVAVEAVCVVNLNYGECDTATRNCATEWSLRVTATQLLKRKRHGREVKGI